MSKLSAQCDELRTMAESVGLEVPQAATLMMEAADTIDRLESENHMLRELVAEMMIALHEYAEKAQSENAKLLDENARLRSCLSDDADNARQIMAENAKLRELCEDMMRFFEDGSYCTTCEKVAECDASEIYECDCLMRSVFKGRMRELGVEVD